MFQTRSASNHRILKSGSRPANYHFINSKRTRVASNYSIRIKCDTTHQMFALLKSVLGEENCQLAKHERNKTLASDSTASHQNQRITQCLRRSRMSFLGNNLLMACENWFQNPLAVRQRILTYFVELIPDSYLSLLLNLIISSLENQVFPQALETGDVNPYIINPIATA